MLVQCSVSVTDSGSALDLTLAQRLVFLFPPLVYFLDLSEGRVVVCTAAFHARVRGSVPGLGGLK